MEITIQKDPSKGHVVARDNGARNVVSCMK